MTCTHCQHIDRTNPTPGAPHPAPGFGYCTQSRGWVKLGIERPNREYPCKPA